MFARRHITSAIDLRSDAGDTDEEEPDTQTTRAAGRDDEPADAARAEFKEAYDKIRRAKNAGQLFGNRWDEDEIKGRYTAFVRVVHPDKAPQGREEQAHEATVTVLCGCARVRRRERTGAGSCDTTARSAA